MKKIVFLGNPNVGKSALINAMCKSKIKVGNWPGVTVDKIEAKVKHNDVELSFLDLPGSYNFNDTAEEKITTNELLKGDYDLIVNVLDSTNLDRNLYLTLIARELNKPMIVLLNFADDLKKKGAIIDTEKLARYLQVPVFLTSATKHTGINEVLDYIARTNFEKEKNYNIYYDNKIDKVIVEIYKVLEKEVKKPIFGYNFLAYRLFEGDEKYFEYVDANVLDKVNNIVADFNKGDAEPTGLKLQVKRYNQITNVLQDVVDEKGVSRYSITRKIDKIVLHKVFGLPIFILFAIYFLSLIFNVANPFIDWVDGFISGYVGYYLSVLVAGGPEWFQSMMLDGVLGGIGGILVFTPLMYFIYLMMAILEESGLMSRVAFLMDRVMRGIGLNGKSFICMILGFGCSVPAIAATRTLEGEKTRKATAIMIPFFSCGARLPVYALFGAAFFDKTFGLVVASIYILGILTAIVIGLVLKKMHYFDEEADIKPFTIELPPYRLPEPRILFKNVNNKLKGFLKRVITLVFAVLFVIWAFNYFPNGKAEDSYLSKFTNVVQPIFMPAGFGESKEAVAAIPTSIAAKEAVVGTIEQLRGIGEEEEDTGKRPEDSYFMYHVSALGETMITSIKGIFLPEITGFFDASPETTEVSEDTINDSHAIFTGPDAPVKAYAYLVFILMVVPCAVAIATIRQEFGTKFMWKIVGFMLILPYTMSIIVYQIGRLFF